MFDDQHSKNNNLYNNNKSSI